MQQAKLEAGFSILRTLIGGAATPTASDKLASTTVSLPSTAPTLAAEPDGALSLHAGYQLQTRAQQTAGLRHARKPARVLGRRALDEGVGHPALREALEQLDRHAVDGQRERDLLGRDAEAPLRLRPGT